jgi:hypothetical protein
VEVDIFMHCNIWSPSKSREGEEKEIWEEEGFYTTDSTHLEQHMKPTSVERPEGIIKKYEQLENSLIYFFLKFLFV